MARALTAPTGIPTDPLKRTKIMPRFCGKCGAAANEKATFCNKCGHRLGQRKAIRFSGGERPAPANPYKAAAPAAPAAPAAGIPTGVQPAVSRAGRKEEAPPAPSVYTASSGTPAAPAPTTSRPAAEAPPLADGAPSSSPGDLSRLDSPLPLAMTEDDQLTQARNTVRSFALWSAGIVLFPLPFSELIALIPVQTAMILSLSRTFNVQEPPEKILAYIAATSGVTVFGQVTMIIVSNLLPIVGKLVSAPFIYGWTYGLGEVAIRYFQTQGEISGDEMKQVFKQSSKQASKQYRSEKQVSKEESLHSLQEHMSPEEYEQLRKRFGSA